MPNMIINYEDIKLYSGNLIKRTLPNTINILFGIKQNEKNKSLQSVNFSEENISYDDANIFLNKNQEFLNAIINENLPDEAMRIYFDSYTNAILAGSTVEEATAIAWSILTRKYIKASDITGSMAWINFSESDDWKNKLLSENNPIIDVFRAGDYPQGHWEIEDLNEMVSNYNVSIFKAPVTLDHAQAGPAMGWVEKIFRSGDVLYAQLSNLTKLFKEKIKTKEYLNRSIEIFELEYNGEFYWPYFKAVSFLGAAPPQVKGLSEPMFKEKKITLISVDNESFNANISENQKGKVNKMAENKTIQFTQEELDKRIKSAQEEALAQFKEKMEAENNETEKFKQLNDENKSLKEQLDKVKKDKNTQYVEDNFNRLYSEGKVLKHEKEFFVNFCNVLIADEDVIEFTEKIKGTPLKAFLEFLQQMKKRVPANERLTNDDPNKHISSLGQNKYAEKYSGGNQDQIEKMDRINKYMKENYPDAKVGTSEYRQAFIQAKNHVDKEM